MGHVLYTILGILDMFRSFPSPLPVMVKIHHSLLPQISRESTDLPFEVTRQARFLLAPTRPLRSKRFSSIRRCPTHPVLGETATLILLTLH